MRSSECVCLCLCVCESAESLSLSLALSLCFNTKSLLEGGAKKEAETDGATVDGSGARSGGPRRHPFTYITGFRHRFGANVTAEAVKGFSHVCNYARAVSQGRFQDFQNGVAQEGTMKTAERGGRAHETKMLGQ